MKYHEKDFAYLLGLYRERAGLTQQELAYKISIHRNTIASWEARGSLPKSRGQVLRLVDELFLTTEERKAFVLAAGFSTERWPTEVWTVPQQRDMFFTGRDDVFQSLRELLVPGSVTALTQAINGLGGIGKTATAVEYAYRYHQYYEAVLWLQADSWEVLTSACIKLADELGLPEQQEIDQIVAEVQRWLRKHRHWLLILDNLENPQETLPKFVPTRHQGSVLVTTRMHSVEPLAQTQMLSTLSEQEGVIFLLRRTTRIASKAGLEKADPKQYDEAKQVWQLMDGLPLALDQAGAYILETGCSFPAYREQYTRRRAQLLHRRGKRFIGHETSVATTFSLAFERVERLNPVAADILRACSLLHSEAIPEEIFQEGAEHLGSRLATIVDNWDLVVGMLQDYSLMQRNTHAKTLTMHRLVQAVLQDGMPASDQEIWTKRVIDTMETVFPQVEYTTWHKCERLVPHALACTTSLKSWQDTNADLASPLSTLLHKIANYLADRAQYTEAEPLYQRALHILEQNFGSDHPEVASLLTNLANLYSDQGKYAQAEPLYQRALHIREQQGGPEHPEVATSLTNLATLYYEQDRYEEAEPLYQRALRVAEQALGLDHPEVAPMLYGLGSIYHDLGKYAEAEPLYQRALHIWEQNFGSDHPEVASALIALAILYRVQAKYTEAEPLYQRALHIWEQTLGSDHPRVTYALNGLATLYRVQGKYAQAEPLYQRALHIREQQGGPEHPEVATSLYGLGSIYHDLGKYAEAEPLYQRALHIWEQLFGAHHPKTTETRSQLVALLQTIGRHEEAAQLESVSFIR